ncbi:MAG: hypothetical protein ACOYOB_19480 [Myxococcota bacterium]
MALVFRRSKIDVARGAPETVVETSDLDFGREVASDEYDVVADLTAGRGTVWCRGEQDSIEPKKAAALVAIIESKGTLVSANRAHPASDSVSAAKEVAKARKQIDVGDVGRWHLIKTVKRSAQTRAPSYRFAPESDATYYLALPGRQVRVAVPKNSEAPYVDLQRDDTLYLDFFQCYGEYNPLTDSIWVAHDVTYRGQGALRLPAPWLYVGEISFEMAAPNDADARALNDLATAMPRDGCKLERLDSKKYQFCKYLARGLQDYLVARAGTDSLDGLQFIGNMRWFPIGDGIPHDDCIVTSVAIRRTGLPTT